LAGPEVGEATGPPETTRGLAGVPRDGGELQDEVVHAEGVARDGDHLQHPHRGIVKKPPLYLSTDHMRRGDEVTHCCFVDASLERRLVRNQTFV